MKEIIFKIGDATNSNIGQFILKAALWVLYLLMMIKEIITAIEVYQKHSIAVTLFVMAISFIVTHFFYKTQKRALINK